MMAQVQLFIVFCRSTAATLTVFSLKKDVHCQDILEYTRKVKSLKDEIGALEGARDELNRRSNLIRRNKVPGMQRQIEDLRAQSLRLQQKTMLLDEAQERLTSIKQSSLKAVSTSQQSSSPQFITITETTLHVSEKRWPGSFSRRDKLGSVF